MKIKEALNDGTLSLEDNIDYADMTEEEYKQEIERLNNIIEKLEQENAVLKTQVVNKDKYSYGIRTGSDYND